MQKSATELIQERYFLKHVNLKSSVSKILVLKTVFFYPNNNIKYFMKLLRVHKRLTKFYSVTRARHLYVRITFRTIFDGDSRNDVLPRIAVFLK